MVAHIYHYENKEGSQSLITRARNAFHSHNGGMSRVYPTLKEQAGFILEMYQKGPIFLKNMKLGSILQS